MYTHALPQASSRLQRALHVCFAKRNHKLAPASNAQKSKRKPAGPKVRSGLMTLTVCCAVGVFKARSGALRFALCLCTSTQGVAACRQLAMSSKTS